MWLSLSNPVIIVFLCCFQSTAAEIPLDLSKKLKEELMHKLHEIPLDLSQKNVTTTDVREDTKPYHLLNKTLWYTPASCSTVPTAQSRQPQSLQSVNPLLSVFGAYLPVPMPVPVPVPATLVQKVSPVRPQTYSRTAAKQIDSTARNCIVAGTPRPNQIGSLPACVPGHADLVRPVHPGGRIVSVVKPSASSVSDTQLLSTTLVGPMTMDNRSLRTLLPSQPIHRNQKVGPLSSSAMPVSFDTCRTDRGLPLAQVYPSRVVMSTVQNPMVETAPSPIHSKKELMRKSPANRTQLLDKSCPTVCSASATSDTKMSLHVETVGLPVPVPVLSPRVSSSSSLNHAAASTVSPELSPAKSTSGKGILPPVETSPISLSDRDSILDEYDSGHELFSTHMEWDDNNGSEQKDLLSDGCPEEELSVKRPAFEVVCDCNRTLLGDTSRPCYATVAFDHSLLQNKSDNRDFISRTKYYRFFTRKAYPAGGGDLDAVQSDKCSSPSVTSLTSQELRLPVPLSSALKGSSSSKSKPKASGAMYAAAMQNIAFPNGGNVDDSFTTESDCKQGLLDKRVRSLHQKPSVNYDIVGSVYSPTFNTRPKGSNRLAHSSTALQVKSEFVEPCAGAENKPGVLARTVCRTRRTEMPPGTPDSGTESVADTDESKYAVGQWDKDCRKSATTVDVKTTVRYDQMKYVPSGSCNKMRCEQDQRTESTVVSGSVNSGKKNPHGIRHRKPGDANNNQGATVDVPTASRPTSISERKHLKGVCQLVKTEPKSDDGSQQSAYVPQNAKVPVHTRACTGASKSETSSTYRLCSTIYSASKERQVCSGGKLKPSIHSADSAASLFPSKSDETFSEQTFTTSKLNRQKFRSVQQPNKCPKEQSAAKVDVTVKGSKSDSSVTASDVTDAHSKAQSSILRQLESSKGYVAEKNIKYSRSEDLFDDSSLLSREQRSLRVSNTLQVKTDIAIL